MLRWQVRIARDLEKHEEWKIQAEAARGWRLGKLEDDLDGADPEDSAQDRVRVNLLQQKHKVRKAGLVAKKPRFFCRAVEPEERDPEQLPASQIDELALNEFWDQNDMKAVFRKITGDFDDGGRGLGMVDFVNEVETVPVRAMPDELEEEAGPAADSLRQTDHRHHLVREQVNSFWLPTTDVVFDSSEPDDPLSGRYFFCRYRRNAEDVLRQGGWANPDAAEEAFDALVTEEDVGARRVQQVTSQFVLYDVWDKSHGMRYRFIKDHWDEPLHWEAWPRGLYDEMPLTDEFGEPVVDEMGEPVTRPGNFEFPLFIMDPDKDNNELYTRPDGQDLVGMQRVVNKLTRLEVVAAVRNLPRVLVKEGSEEQEQIDAAMNSELMAAVIVGDPNNYKSFTPAALNTQIMDARDKMIYLFNETSATTAFQRGQSADRKVTATEASYMESGSRTLADYDQDALTDCIKRWAKLTLKMFHGMGTRPIEVPVFQGTSQRMALIRPEDVQPKCTIDLRQGGTRHYDRESQIVATQQHIDFILDRFGPVPETGDPGLANKEVLFGIFLDVIGWNHEGIKNELPPDYLHAIDLLKADALEGKSVDVALREASNDIEQAAVDRLKAKAQLEVDEAAAEARNAASNEAALNPPPKPAAKEKK